jgi:hypothetical protein
VLLGENEHSILEMADSNETGIPPHDKIQHMVPQCGLKVFEKTNEGNVYHNFVNKNNILVSALAAKQLPMHFIL